MTMVLSAIIVRLGVLIKLHSYKSVYICLLFETLQRILNYIVINLYIFVYCLKCCRGWMSMAHRLAMRASNSIMLARLKNFR